MAENVVDSQEMLRILNDYLQGKPVTQAQLEQANALFETHGGGARLLKLAKDVGLEMANTDRALPSSPVAGGTNVIDLHRVRIQKRPTGLTVIEGPAVAKVASWMGIEEYSVHLDVGLSQHPQNRLELLIESVDEQGLFLNVLSIYGPEQNNCTIAITTPEQESRFAAHLTRRMLIESDTMSISVSFGDAGALTVDIELS